jgi:Protein of unknown function (DUF3225)
MEIDLPDLIAEVKAAFERYEQALVSNDVVVLDSIFRDDPRVIRYGGGENLYGFQEIAAFPGGALAGRARPHPVEDRHHHLWPRFCGGFDPASSPQHARQGRSTDADMGALPGRLARRRRACERH